MHDSPSLLDEYVQEIGGKAPGTVDVYQRILRDLTIWLAERPGNQAGFLPEQLTQTALAMYLEQLKADGYSRSHRARVKVVVSGFARWWTWPHDTGSSAGSVIEGTIPRNRVYYKVP